MKYTKWFLASAALLGTLALSSPAMAGKCIMLGWTGGAAKTNFKWVKGWLTKQPGRKFTIRYRWRGGKMTGHIDGRNYHGVWTQNDRTWGKFSLFLPYGRRKIVFGWWSKRNGARKYSLAVKHCRGMRVRPPRARNKCIRIGWTGGTARRNFKWVGGQLYTRGGGKFTIRYRWKGGTMTGYKVGRNYTGTWRQNDGTWGKFSLYLPYGRRKIVFGWWSKKHYRKRYALAVGLCR